MEGSSVISQINSYKYLLEDDFDDFVDFLYSKKLINEQHYYNIHPRSKHDRIGALLDIIHSSDKSECVLKYLKDIYPNHEKEIEEQRKNRLGTVRGDLPELPPYYVTRKSLVEDVIFKLQDLKYNTKLVIHGMMGYGKSCLINNILRDNKIREYFDNYIFWINLGDCHDKDNVWQPMWRLYTMASTVLDLKTNHCPDDLGALKDLLINLFLNERLKNSLIILDDVGYKDVLDEFDIKCKTVITTQDKEMFRRSPNVTFVEVSTGFSKNESLELFRKSLKTNELPSTAEEIHTICQGHPLLISLIGSYLNDNIDSINSLDGNDIWSYIKKLFSEGNYRLNEYLTNEVDVKKIVKKCLDKFLTDNLKEFYQDLAIFEQDVNIPIKVLEILWNKSSFEVKNIMNALASKSLIVPFFHNDLNTPIYGIHEIYLTYLKETATNMKDLHRKLIHGYDKYTKGDFTQLPNDNYTLQFIGYHLYNAEEFDKFKVYFDLKFIELKLKAVGKEDVLRDMKKYEVYITRGETVLNEKLKEYKDFILRCGSKLYSHDKLDIIQYALREKKESYVFKDAFNIAKCSNHLYFQLQKPCEELDYSPIIHIKDDITAACFVDSLHHILIGTANGRIKLIYEQSVKEISNFVGHVGRIDQLIVSPDKRYFLSVSIDGTVMLWKFAADSSRNSWDFTNDIPISPKTKQSYWQDIHTADRGKISPFKTFKIFDKDDFLVSAAFCNKFPDLYRIATGTHQGNVIVWDVRDENKLYTTGRRGTDSLIPSLLYLYNEDEEVVIFCCQDMIFTYIVINNQLQYEEQWFNDEKCNYIYKSYDSYLAVGDTKITRWKRKKKSIIFDHAGVEKINTCSTLTYDSKYLVVSTNKKTVYILDMEENKFLREFDNKGLAKCLDTFFDADNSVHILLIGSDKKTLQQCHIQPHGNEPQISNIPAFTPFWRKKNVRTAITNPDNRLQVFSGYIQISESEPIDSTITCTCFSICGNIALYGSINGRIGMFDVRTKMECVIQKPNGKRVTYLKTYDPTRLYYPIKSVPNSSGSCDSLDMHESYIGVIVAVFDNRLLSIYNGKVHTVSIELINPLIFIQLKQLLIIDSSCKFYKCDPETGTTSPIKNQYLNEVVSLKSADYCAHKNWIGVFYQQNQYNYFDLYVLVEDYVEFKKRIVMYNEKVNALKFSCDGSVLAFGMNSGDIKVFDLNKDFSSINLKLHEDPVTDLVFAPNKEPILVSVSDEIGFWSLKFFTKPIVKHRPKNLDILNNISSDLDSMNISYWSDRVPIKDTKYLLSYIKLIDKAIYLSASNDFNSFLCVDKVGKIYIMEVINVLNE